WTITAIIRICIGSATVAGLTAASLLGNFLSGSNISPALMVLSIGAGSLCCSHVNDSGFWMFKAYFNLTVKETLLSWTIMETIVSVVGLLG
ncbi:gluconate permease, partial [Staphylococcus aureus]